MTAATGSRLERDLDAACALTLELRDVLESGAPERVDDLLDERERLLGSIANALASHGTGERSVAEGLERLHRADREVRGWLEEEKVRTLRALTAAREEGTRPYADGEPLRGGLDARG